MFFAIIMQLRKPQGRRKNKQVSQKNEINVDFWPKNSNKHS